MTSSERSDASPPAPEPSSPARDAAAGTPAPVGPYRDSPPAADRGARLRALLGRWGVSLATLAAALIVTGRTHGFFMFPYATPVSNDEGYISAMALRMVRGHFLPYVDGVSQRGPILYWLSALVMRVFGLWSWMPVRGLALALGFAEVLLTFALTATLFSPAAGAAASLVVTYFLCYELNPWDGVGLNGEPLAVVFALGAALLVARMQTGHTPGEKRLRAALWAGVLSACAGLTKQMFLLHAVPLALWLWIGPRGEGEPPSVRARVRELLRFGAGLAAPFVLVVGVYAATGNLGTFVYYYQRYGRDIFMDPLTIDYIRDKFREQIDKYFMGVAALGGAFFFALAQALREALPAAPPGTTRRPGGITRFSPEAHVLANVLVPGSGAVMLRAGGQWGWAATPLAAVIVGVRAWLRQQAGVGYLPVALARDVGIYLGVGAASALLTAAILRRANEPVRFAELRRAPELWFALVQMLLAFAGACFTFRFFPHYFVEFFPFAAVVAGAVIGRTYDAVDERDWRGAVSSGVLLGGGVALLLVAHSALHRNVIIRRESDRWYQNPAGDPIVRYVQEHTSVDQTLFVWGFRAETYVSAHRWPASRYVYTVYPAGVVPWFSASHEEEERRVVPGSREILLADLDREEPELIVDAGRSMSNRYMYNYPTLRSYLDRKYCFMRYVDGEPVYRRRHGDRCPPADY